MELYYIITAFFVLYSFYSFQKSFLTFALAHVIFNAGLAIRFAPPSISIDLFLCIYFSILYFSKISPRIKTKENPFFLKPFIIFSISYLLSTLVSTYNGNSSALTYFLRILITQFLFVFVLWQTLNIPNSLKIFVKRFFALLIIIYGYGIFEYLTNSNPILSYISSLIPPEYSQDKLYFNPLNIRGGRNRLQSLFSISILYGVASVIFLSLIIQLKELRINIFSNKLIYILLISLTLFGVYLSNSKTPLIGLPLVLAPLIFKKNSIIIFPLFLFFTFILVEFVDIQSINHIFDFKTINVKNNNNSEGSTANMRLIQLEVSYKAFLNNPIIGNGLRYSSILASKNSSLLGAESVWFKLLIEQGVFGLISFIYLIFSFIKESLKLKILKSNLIGLTISFFLMVSITDVGFDIFYIVFILIHRLVDLKQTNKNVVISTNLSK